MKFDKDITKIKRVTFFLRHSVDAIWHVHLWGPMTHYVRWGVWPPPQGKWTFGAKPPAKTCSWKLRPNHPSVLCCHLASTNEELGGLAGVIPPFARLLWSLLDTVSDRVMRDVNICSAEYLDKYQNIRPQQF